MGRAPSVIPAPAKQPPRTALVLAPPRRRR
jgi:hypothetical protein